MIILGCNPRPLTVDPKCRKRSAAGKRNELLNPRTGGKNTLFGKNIRNCLFSILFVIRCCTGAPYTFVQTIRRSNSSICCVFTILVIYALFWGCRTKQAVRTRQPWSCLFLNFYLISNAYARLPFWEKPNLLSRQSRAEVSDRVGLVPD